MDSDSRSQLKHLFSPGIPKERLADSALYDKVGMITETILFSVFSHSKVSLLYITLEAGIETSQYIFHFIQMIQQAFLDNFPPIQLNWSCRFLRVFFGILA